MANDLRLIVFCAGEVSSYDVPSSGDIVIGRGEDSRVRINHSTISRKHATITIHPDATISIVDHGSSNGTSVEGTRLEPNTPQAMTFTTIAELGDALVILQRDSEEQVTGSHSISTNPPSGHELSPAMIHLTRLIDNVALSNISVLLRSEVGVGRTSSAEMIHSRSARAETGAFVKADPTQLDQATVERALGGTLFLDEIERLDGPGQERVLELTQGRDVRFVSSTHEDLDALIGAGRFRADLHRRLVGVTIWIPPLRERVVEIPRLANEILYRACKAAQRSPLTISDAAMAVLKAYHWPGNTRELRLAIERAVAACKSISIAPAHLGLPFDRTSRPPPPNRP